MTEATIKRLARDIFWLCSDEANTGFDAYEALEEALGEEEIESISDRDKDRVLAAYESLLDA